METPIIPAANLEANLASYPAANLAAQAGGALRRLGRRPLLTPNP